MVRKNGSGEGQQLRWNQVHDSFRTSFPNVYAILVAEDDFVSLLLKARPDGSCLAVLKRYGSDGGPMVCFGSGYGAVACILGLDYAVQGNKWKVDEPWEHPGR